MENPEKYVGLNHTAADGGAYGIYIVGLLPAKNDYCGTHVLLPALDRVNRTESVGLHVGVVNRPVVVVVGEGIHFFVVEDIRGFNDQIVLGVRPTSTKIEVSLETEVHPVDDAVYEERQLILVHYPRGDLDRVLEAAIVHLQIFMLDPESNHLHDGHHGVDKVVISGEADANLHSGPP